MLSIARNSFLYFCNKTIPSANNIPLVHPHSPLVFSVTSLARPLILVLTLPCSAQTFLFVHPLPIPSISELYIALIVLKEMVASRRENIRDRVKYLEVDLVSGLSFRILHNRREEDDVGMGMRGGAAAK